MVKKMLIDATHPEETRVVVLDGSKLEDFDFESASKRQIAGNIYLAKVTRVEPSLQAAFVEYGGNRHGFLAFAEIHPDYYQIPKADREALMAEEEAAARREALEEARRDALEQAEEDRNAGNDRDDADADDAGPDAAAEAAHGDGAQADEAHGDAAQADAAHVDVAQADVAADAETPEGGTSVPDAPAGDPRDAVAPAAEGAEGPREADAPAPRTLAESAGTGEDERTSEDYDPAARKPENDAAPETAAEAPAVGGYAPETPDPEATGAPAPEVVASEAAPAEAALAEGPAPEAAAVQAPTEAAAPDMPAAPEATAAEQAAAAAPAETAPIQPDAAQPDAAQPDAALSDAAQTDAAQTDAARSAEDEAEGEDGDRRRRRSRRGGRTRRARKPRAEEGEAPAADADVVRKGAPDDARPDDAGLDDADDAEPSIPDRKLERDTGDFMADAISARRIAQRRYKIQEVIKVRQILLVQVVKEERGNKGAALTTYLSLAGRYCVLMPNTARGGGISRKITNAADRKKLKEMAGELEVPRGMGLIVRTAGAKRTKPEIKRDYEYLIRQWAQIRETTLRSVAPTLIYEEGSLIKRVIRDLYSSEFDGIQVEGEEGFREAHDYMGMLMPGHARNVTQWTDPTPLFARHQVEAEIDGLYNPTVQLKSGGYIVIGITEALVAIDINSGRSTKEGSIEDTALKTNLEAADEISRQMRLRDLAGLIVIDFIDMEEPRNNRAVEKRVKDRLQGDRARIQIGRISSFGLMEMSRQRLRPGMIEATTAPCAHCHGTGLVRSDGSLALAILRRLETEAARGRDPELKVRAPLGAASYLVNDKREHLLGIEARFGISVRIEADPTLISPDFHVERMRVATRRPALTAGSPAVAAAPYAPLVEEAEVVEAPAEIVRAAEPAPSEERRAEAVSRADDGLDENGRKRRGRRGGRRRRRGPEEEGEADAATVTDAVAAPAQAPSADTAPEAAAPAEISVAEAEEGSAPEAEIPAPKRTRRRRKPKTEDAAAASAPPEAEAVAPEAPAVAEKAAAVPEAAASEPAASEPAATEPAADARPAPETVGEGAVAETPPAPAEAAPLVEAEVATVAIEDAQVPAEPEASELAEVAAPSDDKAGQPDEPKRRGWWSFAR